MPPFYLNFKSDLFQYRALPVELIPVYEICTRANDPSVWCSPFCKWPQCVRFAQEQMIPQCVRFCLLQMAPVCEIGIRANVPNVCNSSCSKCFQCVSFYLLQIIRMCEIFTRANDFNVWDSSCCKWPQCVSFKQNQMGPMCEILPVAKWSPCVRDLY